MAGYNIPPFPPVAPSAGVTAKTGNATLAASEFDAHITNTGASGAITLTLPAASAVAGRSIRLYTTAAQIINLSPAATEKVWLAGSGVVNKDLIIAGVIGNFADVYSDGENYHCTNHSGAVTKEA